MTGDYASLQKGIVYYEGRTDSQIKIRGHRVDMAEVEKNLLELEGVDKGIVLCYHAGEIDQAILGFVTVTEDSHFKTGLQIEGALEDKLAHYMIPQVIILETIPLLVNGKIDRQSLLKMYENTNNNGEPDLVTKLKSGWKTNISFLFQTTATLKLSMTMRACRATSSKWPQTCSRQSVTLSVARRARKYRCRAISTS
jgi:hypothetical protein